jgi:hypothetical protein
VAALDLLPGRGASFDELERVEEDSEPLARLYVRLRGVELRERRVAY